MCVVFRGTCYFYLKIHLNGYDGRDRTRWGAHSTPRHPCGINERFKRTKRDGMDGVEGREREMDKVKTGRGMRSEWLEYITSLVEPYIGKSCVHS